MVAVGVHFKTEDVFVGRTHGRAVVPFSAANEVTFAHDGCPEPRIQWINMAM